MTNEQILKWAAEAGISDWFLGTEDFQSSLQAKRIEQLKKFAELCSQEINNEMLAVVRGFLESEQSLEQEWGDIEYEHGCALLSQICLVLSVVAGKKQL